MNCIESLMFWLMALTGQPGADPGVRDGARAPTHEVRPAPAHRVEAQRSRGDEDEEEEPEYTVIVTPYKPSKQISNGL